VAPFQGPGFIGNPAVASPTGFPSPPAPINPYPPGPGYSATPPPAPPAIEPAALLHNRKPAPPDAHEDGPPDGSVPLVEEPLKDAEPHKKDHKDNGPGGCWQPFYTNYGPCVYVDAEYLHWWIKPLSINPPLLTTGEASAIPGQGSGILGSTGTTILFGQDNVSPKPFDGARITIGGWLDCGYRSECDRPIGIEASYMVLGRVATHFSASSDSSGNPLLARPVVDAASGAETALLVSTPLQSTNTPTTSGTASASATSVSGAAGSFNVDTSTEMWGAELNVFVPLIGKSHFMLGGLIGARYLNFEEGVGITQQTSVLGNGVAFLNGLPAGAPATLAITDSFDTRNNFYGGQLGAQASLNLKNVTLTAMGKIALGAMQQQALINGQTGLSLADQPVASTTGGLLALPSNMGKFNVYQFAVVPEGAVNISVQLTDKIHIHAGYTFLYLNNVVRPGNQIDRVIDPTQLPSSQSFTGGAAAHPAFDFQRTEFWVHGVTAGLGFTF
jgi:hypothetical protein